MWCNSDNFLMLTDFLSIRNSDSACCCSTVAKAAAGKTPDWGKCEWLGLESSLEASSITCLAPGPWWLESWAQLGLLTTTNMWPPCGLCFSHQGHWVPRVGVWRPSIPGESGRSSLSLSGLTLAVVHCHFHCILLVMMNLWGQPGFKRRRIRFYLFVEFWQGHFTEGHVGWEMTILENKVCYTVSQSSNLYMS